MKPILPLALAATCLALPAPAHRLSAEIDARRTAPFRISLAYRLGIGEQFDLDIRAGMTSGKGRPLQFSGGIGLHSPKS